MNILNHLKEIKYRFYYLIFSFIISLIITLKFKETLIYINFWYFFSETPIYYSGILEYYLIILELCLFFNLQISFINLILNLYAFFRPILYQYELKKLRIKIFIYILFYLISILIIFKYLFPLFYLDFGVINQNIEFLPHINQIKILQNRIILIINIILILLISISDKLIFNSLTKLSTSETKSNY